VRASRALALLAVGGLAVGAVQAARGVSLTVEPRQWVLVVVATLIGVRVVAYAPASGLGWLFLTIGLSAGLSVSSGALPGAAAGWLDAWVWWPSYALLPALLLVFPTGRLVARRWWPVFGLAVGGAVVTTGSLAWAGWSDPDVITDDGRGLSGPVLTAFVIGLSVLAGCLLSGVAAVGWRWWRSTGAERRMTGWSLLAALLLLAATVSEFAGARGVWVAAVAALPAAAVLAITRYGLHDIDLLLHRSLLYGVLTVLVLGVHAAAVAGFSRLAPDAAEGLAAVAAVLAVQPLRSTAQRRVDRYVYGERNAPYQVLSGLNEQLTRPADPSEVLAVIASSVAAALKLPWVAISIGHEPVPTVTHGRSRGWPRTSLPLQHRGLQVGALTVEARSPEERFTRAELQLLDDLAAQTGPAVSATLLAQDLQRARERLVLAREEERRRLRRDLHDGIGPALAGVRLQLTALRRRLPSPDAAVLGMVEAIAQDLQQSTSELRGIVDDLRPPALDHGLVAALEQVVSRLAGAVQVELTTAGDLEGLPAATEVAAYRIACEAMTNVVKHAGAEHCWVRLARGAGLDVVVTDDGDGAVGVRQGGVGLGSMRERAEELGGSLEIRPHHPKGTCVHASLPA
jgi:signal transduction histidine kinase